MEREQELIAKAKAGDVSAFETLIVEHQKRIFAIAYRIAGNPEDAADMTQEVLVKIFKNLSKFRGNAKFSTWVYRVATNTCFDEQKKLRRHENYSLDQEIETEDGSMAASLADDGPTPDETAERNQVRSAVHAAIRQLGEDHQKVIILRDIEGFSYDEIADMLQCSVGTVKSRINRARATLKKILVQNRELFDDDFV